MRVSLICQFKIEIGVVLYDFVTVAVDDVRQIIKMHCRIMNYFIAVLINTDKQNYNKFIFLSF